MSYSQLLFSFEGRIPRSTLWLKFVLPYSVIYIVCLVLDMVLGTFERTQVFVIATIYALLAIYPTIAVLVKRCHDRGRSGWFFLVGLIPLVNIWPFIEWYFLKGTEGSNPYGPDPLSQP